MDFVTTRNIGKACLLLTVGIMTILGIGLVIFSDKPEDMGMGCFLIIAGFMLYYLVTCLVFNSNAYNSIDLDDVDEFDL